MRPPPWSPSPAGHPRAKTAGARRNRPCRRRSQRNGVPAQRQRLETGWRAATGRSPPRTLRADRAASAGPIGSGQSVRWPPVRPDRQPTSFRNGRFPARKSRRCRRATAHRARSAGACPVRRSCLGSDRTAAHAALHRHGSSAPRSSASAAPETAPRPASRPSAASISDQSRSPHRRDSTSSRASRHPARKTAPAYHHRLAPPCRSRPTAHRGYARRCRPAHGPGPPCRRWP